MIENTTRTKIFQVRRHYVALDQAKLKSLLAKRAETCVWDVLGTKKTTNHKNLKMMMKEVAKSPYNIKKIKHRFSMVIIFCPSFEDKEESYIKFSL